ncbi:MAG: hypothetical protein GY870_16750 [archaeon]|nr:hypothetical protein [archaeon]
MESVMDHNNILDLIQFVSISKDSGSGLSSSMDDLFQWVNEKNSISKFTLDIIAVKALVKTSDIFYQIKRHGLKICFILKNNILFITGADEKVQYQLLEAIIEETIGKFEKFYGGIVDNYSGGFSDTFGGFSMIIDNIIHTIIDKVKFVFANCKACKSTIQICVKNSFIEKSENFPVSLVYIHNGHAILVYIDAKFKVRGAEIVLISG